MTNSREKLDIATFLSIIASFVVNLYIIYNNYTNQLFNTTAIIVNLRHKVGNYTRQRLVQNLYHLFVFLFAVLHTCLNLYIYIYTRYGCITSQKYDSERSIYWFLYKIGRLHKYIFYITFERNYTHSGPWDLNVDLCQNAENFCSAIITESVIPCTTCNIKGINIELYIIRIKFKSDKNSSD